MKSSVRTILWYVLPLILLITGLCVNLVFKGGRLDNPDGYLSPETAQKLGLFKDGEGGAFSGKIAFKRAGEGGFDYQKSSNAMFINFAGNIEHTNIDLDKECKRIGGCANITKPEQ
jgi:hypothetical protein